MTAKEMFKEAGYPKITKEYMDDELRAITYTEVMHGRFIVFYTGNQQLIEISGKAIRPKELKAIDQQVKELGWLDE